MNISYRLALAACYIASLQPLWLLYGVSNGLYHLLYHVVRYRRRIVRKNLRDSFPDKGIDEIVRIEKGFYAWLCDYFVETLKMFSMSREQMSRRMRFEGLEQIDSDIARGRSVTLYLGHYCNWEWVASLPLHLSTDATCTQLYHALENQTSDKLLLYSRERYGALSLDMREAFKALVELEKQGRHTVTGYISDQAPSFDSMHYWPQFLHHDTPTYTGAERIARILNTPVYYVDIERPKRGYYVAKMVKICDEPKQMPRFSITEQYYRLLEQSIHHAPSFWLWSHNRWKRTREQFNSRFSEEERQRILNKL